MNKISKPYKMKWTISIRNMSWKAHDEHIITVMKRKVFVTWSLIIVAKKVKNNRNIHTKNLEKEPDGLAKDEDKDKSKQDKASLWVWCCFPANIVRSLDLSLRKSEFWNGDIFWKLFVYVGLFWQLEFESVRGISGPFCQAFVFLFPPKSTKILVEKGKFCA